MLLRNYDEAVGDKLKLYILYLYLRAHALSAYYVVHHVYMDTRVHSSVPRKTKQHGTGERSKRECNDVVYRCYCGMERKKTGPDSIPRRFRPLPLVARTRIITSIPRSSGSLQRRKSFRATSFSADPPGQPVAVRPVYPIFVRPARTHVFSYNSCAGNNVDLSLRRR